MYPLSVSCMCLHLSVSDFKKTARDELESFDAPNDNASYFNSNPNSDFDFDIDFDFGFDFDFDMNSGLDLIVDGFCSFPTEYIVAAEAVTFSIL